MNANTAQALAVPFHGTELFVVEHNGQPYTPMKPIVEGMGLDWASQFTKLKANTKRWGIVKITIPTLGDLQEAICLPLRKLFGWLMTVSPNKVKPEIRENVIRYQNECDDALWDYWTKGQATRPQNALKFLPEPPTINKAQQGELYNRVSEMSGENGKYRATIWSRFKNHFRIAGYKDLPTNKYGEALEYLDKLRAEYAHPAQAEIPFPPPDPSPKGSHGPDYAKARDRLVYLRSFAERGFPPDTRDRFMVALDELEGCLVRGWTEIDEAMLNFSIGMAFLRRWKGTH